MNWFNDIPLRFYSEEVSEAFLKKYMRLLTHNRLQCNKKGVKNGYPLRIVAKQIEVLPSEFSSIFIKKMISRISWDVFRHAAMGIELTNADQLPIIFEEKYNENTEILKIIHHLLMEVHIKEGSLICPESERVFPIKNYIPNMLLNEDEV